MTTADDPDHERHRRNADNVSEQVRRAMAQLDELVDGVAGDELAHDDAAAVRVLATDARRALELLNAKLLRIPDAQR